MPNLNRWIIEGHVGRDSETRNAGSSVVTNFSVGISEGKKDNKTTTWVNVTCWGDVYLRKGEAVHIEGRFKAREYEAKDGTKKLDVKLECNEHSIWVLAKVEKKQSRDDDFIEEEL